MFVNKLKILLCLYLLNFVTDFPKASAQDCIGKHQIPLENFADFEIAAELHEPLQLKNFDDVLPNETILENDGVTIKIQMEFNESSIPTINFGNSTGLATYRFKESYFQWYSTDRKGYLPMELHVLFYNTKVKDFDQAMARKNNIVVFAFPFKLYSAFQFDILSEYLPAVRFGYQKIPIENLPLRQWIADHFTEYILYEGTSTIYSCQVQVLWTDFKDVLYIDKELYQEFQKLKSYNGQPLMMQMRKFKAPSGPLVRNFKADGTIVGEFMSVIPFIDANVDDNDNNQVKVGFSGAFERLKSLMELGVFIFIVKMFLIFC